MNELYLLFDLDGTLSDPREGIVASYQYAFEWMGLPCPDEDTLTACIGPPLQECFTHLLGPQQAHRVNEAVAYYRMRYAAVGLYENTLYPGIPQCLEALAAMAPLYVVTSKATPFAEKIVGHFGLAAHFQAVHGAELDGSLAAKGDLIAAVLEREGIAPAHAAMIGDREHDLSGAHAHGVAAFGVAWGYGTEAALRAAGAEMVFQRPAELPPYFRHHRTSRPSC